MVGNVDAEVDGDCELMFGATNEQLLDTKAQLLVLGNGDRRACCN